MLRSNAARRAAGMRTNISRVYSIRCAPDRRASAAGLAWTHRSHRPVHPVGTNRVHCGHRSRIRNGRRTGDRRQTVSRSGMPGQDGKASSSVTVQLRSSSRCSRAVPVGPSAPPPIYSTVSPA